MSSLMVKLNNIK